MAKSKYIKLNDQIDQLSRKLHAKTGYSLIHAVLACRDELSATDLMVNIHLAGSEQAVDFFRYNSDIWETFILILEAAIN